jgi:hypothetical protein
LRLRYADDVMLQTLSANLRAIKLCIASKGGWKEAIREVSNSPSYGEDTTVWPEFVRVRILEIFREKLLGSLREQRDALVATRAALEIEKQKAAEAMAATAAALVDSHRRPQHSQSFAHHPSHTTQGVHAHSVHPHHSQAHHVRHHISLGGGRSHPTHMDAAGETVRGMTDATDGAAGGSLAGNMRSRGSRLTKSIVRRGAGIVTGTQSATSTAHTETFACDIHEIDAAATQSEQQASVENSTVFVEPDIGETDRSGVSVRSKTDVPTDERPLSPRTVRDTILQISSQKLSKREKSKRLTSFREALAHESYEPSREQTKTCQASQETSSQSDTGSSSKRLQFMEAESAVGVEDLSAREIGY